MLPSSAQNPQCHCREAIVRSPQFMDELGLRGGDRRPLPCAYSEKIGMPRHWAAFDASVPRSFYVLPSTHPEL